MIPALLATAFTHVFRWRNNPRRAELFGRRCRILVVARRMGSVAVEFENGECVVTSRRALSRGPETLLIGRMI